MTRTTDATTLVHHNHAFDLVPGNDIEEMNNTWEPCVGRKT